MEPVKHIYIPLAREYKSYKGLSEREIKKRLIRQGWEVWRGGLIGIRITDETYPNVRKKYSRLHSLLSRYSEEKLEALRYMCHVHHGMPDYICYRDRRFLFVECKLGHEQLMPGQKKCIEKLNSLGFDVEVHKTVFSCTKTRKALVDIHNGKKMVEDRQTTLKSFSRKHRKRDQHPEMGAGRQAVGSKP